MKFRYGIIGAGNIAAAFAKAVASCTECEVVAIGSRNAEKADAFAARFSLPHAFGSYAELVDCPSIDAVYIATPNSEHFEWAIRASGAGKHVLCEKPLTLTRAEAEEMYRSATEHGVKLHEAFPYRFQPQTIAVLAEVENGAIGEVVTNTGCFGFQMINPTNVRMFRDLGGGSFWDVGVYPLNLVRAVMGSAPKRVSASGKMHENGIDLSCTALLEYDGGKTASVWSSFESATMRRSSIVGTTGWIEFTPANHTDSPQAASYTICRNGEVETVERDFGNGFTFEADAFARWVREPGYQFHGTSQQETLDNVSTVEAVLSSLQTGAAVELL